MRMRVFFFEEKELKTEDGNSRERELKENIKTVVGLMVTAQNLFIYQKREENEEEKNQEKNMERKEKKDSFILLFLTVFGFGVFVTFVFCLVKHQK